MEAPIGDSLARVPTLRDRGSDGAEADDAAGKAFATMQAQAALAGWELVALADGTFTLHRWGQFPHAPDLHAARQFLRQVGAL